MTKFWLERITTILSVPPFAFDVSGRMEIPGANIKTPKRVFLFILVVVCWQNASRIVKDRSRDWWSEIKKGAFKTMSPINCEVWYKTRFLRMCIYQIKMYTLLPRKYLLILLQHLLHPNLMLRISPFPA